MNTWSSSALMKAEMRSPREAAAGAESVIGGANQPALNAFLIISWGDFFIPPCELARITVLQPLGKIIQAPVIPAPLPFVNPPPLSQFGPPRVELLA